MKFQVLCFFLLGMTTASIAQGIRVGQTPGNPDASSGLEVDFSDRGFLPPRLSTAERDAINAPANGLMIFNTTIGCPQYFLSGIWYSQCGTPPFACGDLVTDANGNSYNSVQIGTQCWLRQSLNVTKYRNGDVIPEITVNSEWASATTGAWSYYANNSSYGPTYGRLYNYYAVEDARGLCPHGWHVPTESEWVQLELHLGMPAGEINNNGFRGTTQGGAIKQAGTSLWASPNTGATNSTGFTALPTGGKGTDGTFYFVTLGGDMWSSTPAGGNTAFYRSTYYLNGGIWRGNAAYAFGFAVRCLKD